MYLLCSYIDHCEAEVNAQQLSANTLREIRRYAQPEGHFDFWKDRSVHGLTYGDVEDWHRWLGKKSLSPKTVKNVSNAFKAILRRLHQRGEIEAVPAFPPIKATEHAPRILSIEQQAAVLASIPWERRGAFLVAATECLRLSEIRALDLDDYQDGKLRVDKAVQGNRVGSPIRTTKNRSAQWRPIWSDDLRAWIDWRLEQATPEARLCGEVALFWCPTARNVAKRWAPDPLERQWKSACVDALGFAVPFQEGTRHSTLTALGQVLPERVLREFSRHRDARSLDHYSKPRATPEAIVRALRPGD